MREISAAQIAAEQIFNRITDGRGNAVQRPDMGTTFGKNVDRALRRIVNKANKNGDCIINVGNGYYRPRPGVPVEKTELKEYLRTEGIKANDILSKNNIMLTTYMMWEKEAGA